MGSRRRSPVGCAAAECAPRTAAEHATLGAELAEPSALGSQQNNRLLWPPSSSLEHSRESTETRTTPAAATTTITKPTTTMMTTSGKVTPAISWKRLDCSRSVGWPPPRPHHLGRAHFACLRLCLCFYWNRRALASVCLMEIQNSTRSKVCSRKLVFIIEPAPCSRPPEDDRDHHRRRLPFRESGRALWRTRSSGSARAADGAENENEKSRRPLITFIIMILLLLLLLRRHARRVCSAFGAGSSSDPSAAAEKSHYYYRRRRRRGRFLGSARFQSGNSIKFFLKAGARSGAGGFSAKELQRPPSARRLTFLKAAAIVCGAASSSPTAAGRPAGESLSAELVCRRDKSDWLTDDVFVVFVAAQSFHPALLLSH